MSSGHCHQQGLNVDRAQAVLNVIPQPVKDHPPDADTAWGIGQIAKMADREIPDGCEALVLAGGGNIVPEKKQDYYYPGGFWFTTTTAMKNFILFLYNNQDAADRVLWYNMTGREQFEWYQAFEANGRTHARVAGTTGLRGTNLNALNTPGALAAAVAVSPSLAERRPNHHPVPPALWPVARQLF